MPTITGASVAIMDKTSAIELLVEKLAHSNQHLVNIAEQQCEEIRKLRDVVANASQPPSAVTNITDARAKPTTLLVGDSRLRDVHLEENASGNPIRNGLNRAPGSLTSGR